MDFMSSLTLSKQKNIIKEKKMKKLGILIQECERSGISQSNLAKHMNVSRSYVSHNKTRSIKGIKALIKFRNAFMELLERDVKFEELID